MSISNVVLATPAGLASSVTAKANKPFIPFKHILFLERWIFINIFKLNNRKLAISLPPQTGKSTYCSQWLPAWWLSNYPDDMAIMISYAESLARRNSAKVRDHVKAYGHLYGTQLNYLNRSATRWGIEGRDGGMIAAGVKGGITGWGCQFGVLDDTIQGHKQAQSITYKDDLWDWYLSEFKTRMHTNAPEIIFQTRWAADDLIGRLQQEYKRTGEDEFNFQYLNLPSLAEEDDPMGRELDEPLCPQLHSKKKLVGLSKTEYWFDALHQGRPAKRGGDIIKKKDICYYDPDNAPAFTKYVLSCDFNQKKTIKGSFMVASVWAVLGPNCYLVAQFRERCSFEDAIKNIEHLISLYPIEEKLIEDKANGPVAIETLRKKFSMVMEIPVPKGKEERLRDVSSLFETHNTFVPNPDKRQWVKEWIDEIVGFPNVANDDQVDTTSQALNYLKLYLVQAQSQGVTSGISTVEKDTSDRYSDVFGSGLSESPFDDSNPNPFE